jgi:hypothetical protein
MADVSGLGFGGFGGSCNLVYCIAILLIIQCCMGFGFGRDC